MRLWVVSHESNRKYGRRLGGAHFVMTQGVTGDWVMLLETLRQVSQKKTAFIQYEVQKNRKT